MHTYKSYITGFLLSVVLTLAAYFSVTYGVKDSMLIILALAFIQLVVQLVFFLNIHKGKDRVSNMVTFISTASVIFILIAGSLWIMQNLKYHHMTPEQMNAYMSGQ
jgi:cytochrome o ubiquinol oxidase operon protein cyoD